MYNNNDLLSLVIFTKNALRYNFWCQPLQSHPKVKINLNQDLTPPSGSGMDTFIMNNKASTGYAAMAPEKRRVARSKSPRCLPIT